MKVQIVNMKQQSKSDRHGWSVDFKINNPPKKTVIYQNVYVSLGSVNSEGEKETSRYKFTEAWKYNSKKNITDSFLIPLDWRKNQNGFIRINTVIWSEEGDINKLLKKGNSSADYWGNLHGSFDLLTPKEPVTIRNFRAEWENVGKSAKKFYTKGKDLKLIKNEIH